jgi:hypothetical protein
MLVALTGSVDAVPAIAQSPQPVPSTQTVPPRENRTEVLRRTIEAIGVKIQQGVGQNAARRSNAFNRPPSSWTVYSREIAGNAALATLYANLAVAKLELAEILLRLYSGMPQGQVGTNLRNLIDDADSIETAIDESILREADRPVVRELGRLNRRIIRLQLDFAALGTGRVFPEGRHGYGPYPACCAQDVGCAQAIVLMPVDGPSIQSPQPGLCDDCRFR